MIQSSERQALQQPHRDAVFWGPSFCPRRQIQCDPLSLLSSRHRRFPSHPSIKLKRCHLPLVCNLVAFPSPHNLEDPHFQPFATNIITQIVSVTANLLSEKSNGAGK